MRNRKEVVHELFELRSMLLLAKDVNEKERLNGNIEKIKKELVEIFLEEAKYNNKKGK